MTETAYPYLHKLLSEKLEVEHTVLEGLVMYSDQPKGTVDRAAQQLLELEEKAEKATNKTSQKLHTWFVHIEGLEHSIMVVCHTLTHDNVDFIHADAVAIEFPGDITSISGGSEGYIKKF
jgi:hypothetical protein